MQQAKTHSKGLGKRGPGYRAGAQIRISAQKTQRSPIGAIRQQIVWLLRRHHKDRLTKRNGKEIVNDAGSFLERNSGHGRLQEFKDEPKEKKNIGRDKIRQDIARGNLKSFAIPSKTNDLSGAFKTAQRLMGKPRQDTRPPAPTR